MIRHSCLLFAFASWTLLVGTAGAAQYPMMEAVANKIVQKYQQSSCQQLWQEKMQKQGQPKAEMEERAIQALRNDPQMRQAFINRVAAPIVRVQHDSLRIELFASRSSNENHFTA
jgi:hypothetical protein